VLTASAPGRDCVEAADAVRGDPFSCRACGAPVVLKRGEVRVAHFAHWPDAVCPYGSGMSLAHLEAQRRLADALRARGVHAELEAPAPSLAGDRRIDVLAWPPDRPAARIALEVQASELTVEHVAARTRSYEALGIAPLWLRLLDFGAFERVQTLPLLGAVWVETYRARAWERWAHDHLGGRLWFIDAGPMLAWRGALAPAQAYDESAGEWVPIVQWVELALEGPFELETLRLNRGRVAGADRRNRLAAWFVAPAEDARSPSRPLVRTRRRIDGGSEERELQVEVDGRWLPAAVEGAPGDWRTRGAARAPIIATGPPRR